MALRILDQSSRFGASLGSASACDPERSRCRGRKYPECNGTIFVLHQDERDDDYDPQRDPGESTKVSNSRAPCETRRWSTFNACVAGQSGCLAWCLYP